MTQGPPGFAPSRPWEAHDHAPFAGLPPESWSAELHLLSELVDALTDRACLGILAELGIPVPGHLELLVDDLRLGAGVTDERALDFHWLWRRLDWSGLLTGQAGGEVVDVLPLPWDEPALAAALELHGPRLGTTAALIEHVRASWPVWLRGQKDGKQVLFSRRALELWEGYFQGGNAPIAALNALGAHAAERALAGRTGLRALEVGGGLGSGAQALLRRLGPRLASYDCTELTPVLLPRGEARARSAAPPGLRMAARLLDLDQPLEPQGVAPGGLDLIWGVNTLHAARDLVASLRALRAGLAPGGALVLAECVLPAPGAALAPELVFRLSPQFHQALPEPGVRERGGFLDEPGWRAALQRAGFARVELVPDLARAHAAYRPFAMAAIVARAE